MLPQVDEGVEFDGRLAPPEFGPGKECQAEADGGGVEGVDDGVEIHCDGLIDIQIAGLCHEDLGETFEDARIAEFIGVAQGGSPDITADAQMVKMRGLRTEAGFDIAQAFAEGQLCKDHGMSN